MGFWSDPSLVVTEIAVCIATHGRPAGLRKLLRSLREQTGAPLFDVIVVDNDAERSALPIIAEFADRLSITYLTEPVRGIARTRNRAVGATNAAFLAFVDDDEWASSLWLADLHRVATKTQADAVIGPVRMVFGPGVPAHLQRCRLFVESNASDGDLVPWHATRTSNALVRRSSLPGLPTPFATRFDLSGGEDVDLFRRMILAGAQIRASSTALVFEYRPASRAKLGWVMRRALRNGGTIVDVEWGNLSKIERFGRGIKAALYAIRPAFVAAIWWEQDRTRSVDALISAAGTIGKFVRVCGIRIQEYRSHS